MSSTINLTSNSEAFKIILISDLTAETIENNAIFDSIKFEGKFGQVAFLAEIKSVFVGVSFEGKTLSIDPFNKQDFYKLGAKIASSLKSTKITDIELSSTDIISKDDLAKLLLGLMQGSESFDKYLKEKSTKEYQIYLDQSLENVLEQTDIDDLYTYNKGLNLTRNLVNDTPEAINPVTIVPIIENEFANSDNVTTKFYGYSMLQEMGMEGIVAVGKASDKKPIMAHTIVTPKGEIKKRIVLVGKGLTYDCGGLDIKTGGHMLGMKTDMAGSATMFGITKIISELGLENIELHWLTAYAENMIDGNAYKADDILTSYSGQTIEIHNTDAEGRLTLADVLSFATLLNPDYIIDAATLTWACIGALSEYNTAFMTNSKYLKDTLLAKFEEELEPTVYTPMPEVLREYVKGDISDLMNTSTLERQSGHVTAGLFLSHFVDQNNFRNPDLNIENPKVFDWVHLDIAGSAYNNKHNSLGIKGATGQSVRSIVKWILDEDKKA
jgi:leucyl aminopeptidase